MNRALRKGRHCVWKTPDNDGAAKKGKQGVKAVRGAAGAWKKGTEGAGKKAQRLRGGWTFGRKASIIRGKRFLEKAVCLFLMVMQPVCSPPRRIGMEDGGGRMNYAFVPDGLSGEHGMPAQMRIGCWKPKKGREKTMAGYDQPCKEFDMCNALIAKYWESGQFEE